MLDQDTKRRIDSCRDILVGKVPDPKAQVEQITTALIYKFMDDMDKQSEEYGGKATFFDDGFSQYSWSKLMDPRLGGYDRMSLYTEAISKMAQNPHVDQLFRDIFKDAFLPFRDPETLNMFLKEINCFKYTHSEDLGDAFEYLLSILGSQGDAGQFRTPRHIIDFMAAIVDPHKDDTVLDPACGTAGFLISAYKHILDNNLDADGNSTLTPDEKQRLMTNFTGYDISPDMVRLSLVNLYLHGFPDPDIHEYDTLTSEDRWDDNFDVILANPPFMTPKGGIRPHKRFSVQAKRSEVLFVDYMAEHLNPNGRAGIIVPEGIIFQSQTAYKDLRKMLVETSLWAVISLPAGVFNPYSGVKTSILLLDKALAKKTDAILFLKIDNDGFGLGAQRREIEQNDLTQACVELSEYKRRLQSGESMEDYEPALGLVVEKTRIAANGDYNLSGERFRECAVSTTAYKLERVGLFMKEGVKTIDPRNSPDEIFELWSIPSFDLDKPELVRGDEIGSQKKCVTPGDVLLSRIVPHIRRGWVVKENAAARRQIASTEWIVFSGDEVVSEYLRHILVSDFFHASFMQTITGVGGSLSRANPSAVGEIQIPVPPLDVQKGIVDEIEGYQKVIDGARAVVDNYCPHIPIHPGWPMVAVGNIVDFVSGLTVSIPAVESEGGTPIIAINNVTEDGNLTLDGLRYITPPNKTLNYLQKGDLLFNWRNGSNRLVGKTALFDLEGNYLFASFLLGIRALPDCVHSSYLWHTLNIYRKEGRYMQFMRQNVNGLFNREELKVVEIPLPPLATQQAIVAEIEAEQALVAANRELIERFEKKIQTAIARVWGEEKPNTPEAADESLA